MSNKINSLSGACFSWCPFSPKTRLPQCPSVSKCPFAPQCPFVPIADCSGAHFSWCLFAPNAHFPPMLTSPNVHRSQGAHYAPKCSFAANTCLPWCSCFLVPIFPKCPFATAYLSLCPLASKVFVCPIKCLKYPFAPVTSCPYNCAHFFWCPFFLSAHLPQIAK